MTNPPRNKADAIVEARYSIRLHELHRRFYRRTHIGIVFVTLIAGSTAFVEAIQTVPHAIGVLGLLIAASGFADALGDFSERAATHGLQKRQAADILARSAELDLPMMDAELARLSASETIDIESLRAVAWNDTLKSCGLEHGMRPERFAARLMRMLA